jgi:hypothetical protein
MEKKKMKRISAFLLIFIFAISVCAQSEPTEPRRDFQSWNEIELSVPLGKKVDLEFYGQFRLGRNLSHFVDERAGFGISFKPNKYLTIEPGYRRIAAQPVAGKSTRENRFSLEATVSVPVGKFTVSDRNLVDRRLRSSGNTTQYRNRLQVERPFKISDTEIKLFVSNEVFYDSVERAWIRNRFSIGVSRKFSQRYTGEIYYLRQNDGFSRPGDLNVIGTTLRVRLK